MLFETTVHPNDNDISDNKYCSENMKIVSLVHFYFLFINTL